MSSNLHISIKPEPIFSVAGFDVTNSMLTGGITTVIIILIAWWSTRVLTQKIKPASGPAQFFEGVIEVVLQQIEQIMGSRKKALYYFPLIATLFIFILANNWIAMLPGFGLLTIQTADGPVPLFRAVTADLNATIGLALISVILTHIFALRELGLVGHMRNYFTGGLLMNGVGLMEIVLEFAKVISFSFRLFGNIFAGEVLLIVIASLIPLIGPAPFWGLEIFVGFIQAFVFTMLTTVFIATATAEHATPNTAVITK